MINEICLYFQNDERISEFNQETFAIPELYLISIPKFDSKKVIKCNIFLWENGPFPPKEKILGSADSYQLFDFKKYTSLSEKDYNWDTEPLKEAYQSCLTSDLTFKRQIKKRKLSPNRKQYLSLWAYCDQHYFKITWITSDKKGK